MKFLIKKSSDYYYKDEKEINSFDELLKFIDENESIIMNKNSNIIEIYDDYRE